MYEMSNPIFRKKKKKKKKKNQKYFKMSCAEILIQHAEN